ncbi:MAG: histidine kinase dimerization/phosphoacceptor domain -containing protein [Spirochaetia bacterium]
MNNPKRKSIAGTFSIITFTVILTIGIGFSVLNGYQSYKAEIKKIDHFISQIHQSHVPFLISSLWLTDYNLVNKQIESILRFPYIQKVTVTTEDGQIFSAQKTDTAESSHIHTQYLRYTYKNTQVPVGELSITVNQKALNRSVFRQQVSDIMGHITAAILTALLISVLFQRMVGRHLQDLTGKLKKDHPDKFDTPFTLNRKQSKDELDLLTASINGLRMNLKLHIDEKNLLLHEVHHRIKNNMTTVKGMLLLQEEQTRSTEAASVLREAQGRLQSMTTLYDKLYRTPIDQAISAGEYFPGLLREIIRTYTAGLNVKLDDKIGDIVVPVHLLSILGIILNELVSNSIKHSFAGKTEGIITVSLKKTEGDLCILTYTDDGNLMDPSVITGSAHGLGLTIITMLGAQIGRVVYEPEGKNSVTITFSLSETGIQGQQNP